MNNYNFKNTLVDAISLLKSTLGFVKLRKTGVLVLLFLTIAANAFAQTEIRVSFSRGFIGVKGTSTNSALNIKTFPTLGVTRAYFVQNSTTGRFVSQGNDIPGIVRFVLTS